jgi:hypothetical protein
MLDTGSRAAESIKPPGWLADPLSQILRALDVHYIRSAYSRVVEVLGKAGIRTKKLHFGWVHPGIQAM